MRIDLHAHSTASDGTEAPADVVSAAAAAGIDVLGLTDHETVAGIAEAVGALPTGLTLVPGAEVSCAGGVHLLAYLFDPEHPPLAEELARLRSDRERRGREMVHRLAAMGAVVTWEDVAAIAGDAPVGRPHVAAALVQSGATDYAGAFREWIGPGCPAYVRKHALDPAEGVALVVAAGGVAVAAHPGARRGVDDDVLARMAAAGMSGVEVDHPEHDAATRHRLLGLAADLGLIVTGGSDFHGSRKAAKVGDEGTSPEAYERVLAAATGARVVVG